MGLENQVDEAAEEIKLREFLELQKKWMNFAAKLWILSITIAYILFRPLIDIWPTVLSWLVPSFSEQVVKIILLSVMACGIIGILTLAALNAYRDRLGGLRDSGRVPAIGIPSQKGPKQILIFVALNELTGLVLLLVR